MFDEMTAKALCRDDFQRNEAAECAIMMRPRGPIGGSISPEVSHATERAQEVIDFLHSPRAGGISSELRDALLEEALDDVIDAIHGADLIGTPPTPPRYSPPERNVPPNWDWPPERESPFSPKQIIPNMRPGPGSPLWHKFLYRDAVPVFANPGNGIAPLPTQAPVAGASGVGSSTGSVTQK